MKTTKELLDIIYKYYPKNIGTELGNEYVASPAYQLRKKTCDEARAKNENWLQFRDDLVPIIEKLNGRHADYSALGSVPSYHLRIYFDDWYKKYGIAEIAILVSVISPCWTFFFENSDLTRHYQFAIHFKEGQALINEINTLIQKNFKGYEYLQEKIHQIKVHDISSAHKQAPDLSIFDALFID